MAANDSNVSRVKLVSHKLEFRKIVCRLLKFQSFISKLNVILQGQPLRTICLTLENVLIRADEDEICRYGQLASTLLQQITELQNDYEKENLLFENEAKKRLESTLQINKSRLRIENARTVFEKLRPLLNSFNVIRNHLDTISSHVCNVLFFKKKKLKSNTYSVARFTGKLHVLQLGSWIQIFKQFKLKSSISR